MLRNFFKYLIQNKTIYIIFVLIITVINTSYIYASDPQLYLTPNTGFVKVGEEFIVDVMINSPDNELNLARVSLKFDPKTVKVKKAERNEAIFCKWVDDQQKIDNIKGVIILTGFCQSGEESLYKTVGGADVLARITFEPLKEGNLTITWEYDGTNNDDVTILTEDGSPPQIVLKSKPDNVMFTASVSSGTITDGNNGTSTTENKNVPQTSLVSSSTKIGISFVFIGAITLTILSIYQNIQKKINSKKFKTVVVYE